MSAPVIELSVRGMDCEHCVRAVTDAVRALDPAAIVRVDLPGGSVRAETVVGRDAVVRAVEAEGYEVAAG